jgi:hypothetical protein
MDFDRTENGGSKKEKRWSWSWPILGPFLEPNGRKNWVLGAQDLLGVSGPMGQKRLKVQRQRRFRWRLHHPHPSACHACRGIRRPPVCVFAGTSENHKKHRFSDNFGIGPRRGLLAPRACGSCIRGPRGHPHRASCRS